MTRNVSCTLRGYGSSVTSAEARIEVYSRGQRWQRAVKGLGLWWAAALGGVFIPVAHFFLVPGCTLTGVYVAISRLRRGEMVVALDGTCPDCGFSQSFDVSGARTIPHHVTCSNCHRSLSTSLEGIGEEDTDRTI